MQDLTFEIKKHQKLVYKIAHEFSEKFQQEEFAELVQLGSIGLSKALSKYNPEKGAISTWCCPWIRGEIQHYLRDKYKLRSKNKLTIQELTYEIIDNCATEENDDIDLKEIRDAIAKLPEQQGKVIQLIYFETLSQKQIGERLNYSPSQIGIIRKRALDNLKRILSGEKIKLPRDRENKIVWAIDTEELKLTSKQLEVAKLISLGMTNKEIAKELCVEISTVINHISNICRNNNLNKRTQIMRKYILSQAQEVAKPDPNSEEQPATVEIVNPAINDGIPILTISQPQQEDLRQENNNLKRELWEIKKTMRELLTKIEYLEIKYFES